MSRVISRSNRSALAPVRLMIILAVVGTLGIIFVPPFFQAKPVLVSIVLDQDNTIEIRTTVYDVQGLLGESQIEVGPWDLVEPALDTPLSDGLVIRLVRAFPVVISDGGTNREVHLTGGTVADALMRAGIALGPLDRTEPSVLKHLSGGQEITVIRGSQDSTVVKEQIPFQIQQWREPSLRQGETVVLRQGREGIREKTYLRTYENGVLVEEQLVSSQVVTQPITHVIGVGTRTAVQVVQTGQGSRVYSHVMEMEATAYTPGPESTGIWSDGYTVTGHVARHGIVAVDPTVIPLGTSVYIPGYGEALAADIGGAIKGHRIDLLFEDLQDALNFGRRSVQVYILEDMP